MSKNKADAGIRTWNDLKTMFDGMNEKSKQLAGDREKALTLVDRKVNDLKEGIDGMLDAHGSRLGNIVDTALASLKAPKP